MRKKALHKQWELKHLWQGMWLMHHSAQLQLWWSKNRQRVQWGQRNRQRKCSTPTLTCWQDEPLRGFNLCPVTSSGTRNNSMSPILNNTWLPLACHPFIICINFQFQQPMFFPPTHTAFCTCSDLYQGYNSGIPYTLMGDPSCSPQCHNGRHAQRKEWVKDIICQSQRLQLPSNWHRRCQLDKVHLGEYECTTGKST